MNKIEIHRNQVYRLAARRERGSKLTRFLRRLFHRRR